MIATWLGASSSPLGVRDISDLNLRPADWTEQAPCARLPVEEVDDMFFPEHGQVTQKVREMCASCPVLTECASASIGEVGIWAGFSIGHRGVA